MQANAFIPQGMQTKGSLSQILAELDRNRTPTPRSASP